MRECLQFVYVFVISRMGYIILRGEFIVMSVECMSTMWKVQFLYCITSFDRYKVKIRA